uniref:Uncharacterized protein n=1 Tax=Molossus molossus TaxID=27622 RepID=A0A7J8JYH7_MOLMO|nr:hypothetical protein HJG59_008128 [Molossus molossus]
MPGSPSRGPVSGASKPKSLSVCGGVPPRREWCGCAVYPPGICTSVIAGATDGWGATAAGRSHTAAVALCLHVASSVWPGPHLMFTCVSGSGVPAWPPPREPTVSLGGGASRSPRPACSLQPVPQTGSGHRGPAHRARSIRTHPGNHCTTFLFIDLCPPSSPRPGIGNLFVWLRGGSSVFVLRWSMGVFPKMVILYDLSWNLC